MDGVASVVYGDLAPTGLPAKVDEDSDDNSAPAQPACLNNYAVSPRQLTRLLRKLQVCLIYCTFTTSDCILMRWFD